MTEAYLRELQAQAQTAAAGNFDQAGTSDAAGTSVAAPDLSQQDTPDVPMRFIEKKRLHWAGKTCEKATASFSFKKN